MTGKLDICKRIAEIEGVPVYYEDNPYYGSNYFRKDTHHDIGPYVYNPLTDDALCFRLMINYQIRLSHDFGKYSWMCFHSKAQGRLSQNEAPSEAICLAIIKLHED